MTAHKLYYPSCPFVLGKSVGNIPLGRQSGREEEAQHEEDLELAVALSLSLSEGGDDGL